MRHKQLPHSVECYIGLGSNLDNPAARLDAALVALDTIPDTKLVQHSSYYRSKPLGPSGQPDYLNAVARLACGLPARQLLGQLQAIENDQGRVRNGPRWGARTLDLDILLYGDEIIDEPELVVPHPQLKHRNFVLMPLLELAPDLDLPGLGRAAEWLARVGHAGIAPA